MTHADFLESLFSRLAKWVGEPQTPGAAVPSPVGHLGTRAKIVSLLERQPLFVLGSWDEIVASIMEFKADLVEDLADGLMMPFPSIAVAFEGKRGWSLEWVHRTGAAVTYVHTLIHETQESAWFRNVIEFEFLGRRNGHFLIQLRPESIRRYISVDVRPPEAVIRDMGHIVEDALLRVALISHPENYVVKRTPYLTPRELRRVDRGGPVPIRKRPYYLVMDHKGLLDLRLVSTSTALRLPILHARRGHWMRLAERCKKVRATGRDRVWRRETYVGDREFKDSASRYSVYLSAAEAAREDIGPAPTQSSVCSDSPR